MHIEQCGKRHSYVSTFGATFKFDGTEADERRAIKECRDFEDSRETFPDNPDLKIGEVS